MNARRPDVRVFADASELCAAAHTEFVARAASAIAARGRFTVALSGGSTPKRLYESLAQAELEWDKLHFFFGDERAVPPWHSESNWRMAHEALFARVPLPVANVHPIAADRALSQASADAVAHEYEEDLRRCFAAEEALLPTFDLILLGMGADGHTASLFPGTSALQERERWVAATWVEKLESFRITLTFPVLNHARAVLFLVSGEDKAHALHTVLEAGREEDALPAGSIKLSTGQLSWLIDRAASAALSRIR